jgi:acyl transferase domain-containing protein
MQYWWHVIRQPIIHQSDAYRSLILDGYNLVLEISADQVYSEEFPDIAAALGKEVEALPSMRKNRGTQSVMAKSLQLLQESGYSLRLTSYNGKS